MGQLKLPFFWYLKLDKVFGCTHREVLLFSHELNRSAVWFKSMQQKEGPLMDSVGIVGETVVPVEQGFKVSTRSPMLGDIQDQAPCCLRCVCSQHSVSATR